jgi:hypothetical protein
MDRGNLMSSFPPRSSVEMFRVAKILRILKEAGGKRILDLGRGAANSARHFPPETRSSRWMRTITRGALKVRT